MVGWQYDLKQQTAAPGNMSAVYAACGTAFDCLFPWFQLQSQSSTQRGAPPGPGLHLVASQHTATVFAAFGMWLECLQLLSTAGALAFRCCQQTVCLQHLASCHSGSAAQAWRGIAPELKLGVVSTLWLAVANCEAHSCCAGMQHEIATHGT